jgi:cation transport ATPase
MNKKEEIFLYLKTLVYNILVGLAFTLPAMFLIWLVTGHPKDVEVLYPVENTYFVILVLMNLLLAFPVYTLTGNFFYKKVADLADRTRLLSTYIKIGVTFNLLYLVGSILGYGVQWQELFLTVFSTVLFMKIFRNVVENKGQINYKKLWQI